MAWPCLARCPILIENVHDLQAMCNDLDGWYIIIKDIDASETQNWNDGRGFVPVGDGAKPFTGILDGQGHTISNLYINLPSMSLVGLFGVIQNGAVVKNVGLIDAEVYGDFAVGTLAGSSSNGSMIFNCYATGEVIISANGSNDTKSGGLVGSNGLSTISQCYTDVDITALSSRYQVGGLCGYSWARSTDPPALIENCYSIGIVKSNGNKVGGLLGDADGDHSTVSKCYAAGLVIGTNKKGLVGYNYYSPTIKDSYWDKEASTCLTSVGGISKTTAEMRQQATFVGWDFTSIWDIDEGSSYPYLRGNFDVVLKLYHVDDDAAGDPAPGDPCSSDPLEDGSTEHPFDSIQEAIDLAAIEDFEVPVAYVHDGIYTGPGNHDIDPRGIRCVIKSENDPWNTVIDCYQQGRGFFIANNDVNCAVIDGFLIFDGDPSAIQDPEQEPQLGGAIYCEGGGPTIRNCVMLENYASGSGAGIYLNQSDATIYRCEILQNFSGVAGAGIFIYNSNPLIQNCVVAGNSGSHSGGISCYVDSNATILNCTISDNYARQYGPDGLKCAWSGHADVKNTIFWTDTRWWQSQDGQQTEPNYGYLPQKHIFLEKEGSLSISYSDVEGGWEGIKVEEDADCILDWGIGNLNADPLFARYFFFDYHLKSGVGRWTPIEESNGDYDEDDIINFKDFAILAYYWGQPDPPQYVDLDNDGLIDVNDLEIFCSRWLGTGDNTAGWLKDDVNSPCLDAGDPNSLYALEPNPNGARVNMGAYGNTDQASMTTGIAIERRFPDLDDDGDVDFIDFALFANLWLQTGQGIEADFDYSNIVNYVDLTEFCRWWLWGK